ncbi:MAG: sugar phosphate isomerase/epimerase family protein [Bryobacteraceae bacterium]
MPNSIHRREFLKAGAVGGSVLAGPFLAFGAEQPQKFKIGMAATTWLSTSPSTATYWNAMEAISQLQIGATEADDSNALLDSAYGNNTAEFVSRSRKVGVHLAGVFQSLLLHDEQKRSENLSKIRSIAGFLKAVNAEYIALGWSLPPRVGGKEHGPTSGNVVRAIRAMDEIGRLSLDEYGIYIAFHAERDIPKATILNVLDQTNPKYVRFCADVGHLTATGLDALQTVKKYASRLAVSHWKDFDPKLPGPDYLGSDFRGDFVEVGKGIVNFRGLADFYREIGYTGWVMLELDRTREASIMASAREMKAFVTEQLKLQFYPPYR